MWAAPGGSDSKESSCSPGDPGSIPGLESSPGEGNGNPLQCSGLENSVDCISHGVAESDTTEQFSLPLHVTVDHTFPDITENV